VIAFALIAVAWLLSVVIRLALSRSREFLADAGSVELTKNPDAMISALRKIENRGELVGATSAVMELCVDNPREGLADLFATHPSIQSRCDKLVQFAGGHDPGPLALPMQAEPEPARLPSSDQAGAEPPPIPDPATPDGPDGPWGSHDPTRPSGPWGSAR
jgi:heat shock protein HtpX